MVTSDGKSETRVFRTVLPLQMQDENARPPIYSALYHIDETEAGPVEFPRARTKYP